MRSYTFVTALLVLLDFLAFPVLSQAQVPARLNSSGALFEAGIASATVDGYQRSSLSELASSLWGAHGTISGVAGANLTRFTSGNITAYGDLHGSIALSPDARNLSAFGIEGGGGAYRGRTSSRYALTSVVVGRTTDDGAVAGWIKGGLGTAGGATMVGSAQGEIGGALRATSVMLDWTLSYATIGASRYGDAVGRAQWSGPVHDPHESPRFTGGVEAGLRVTATDPQRRGWIALSAALRLRGRVSVAAYAGAPPPDPIRATSGVSLTSIALRVFLGPTGHARTAERGATRATSVSANGADGRRVITVLLGDANSVELMGDFTGWSPVMMSRVAPGVWQARVTIDQGSHRMNIRSDAGSWRAPPGIPASPDDFGGSAGILVVP